MCPAAKIVKLQRRLGRLAKRQNRLFLYGYGVNAKNGRLNSKPDFWQKLALSLPGSAPVLQTWNCGLKYSGQCEKAVLVWSDLSDREQARVACRSLHSFFKSVGVTPVLVTSLQDFSFYARLGWLVEYLPPFSSSYVVKKARYLALRYHDLPAFPLEAGFMSKAELLAWLPWNHCRACDPPLAR